MSLRLQFPSKKKESYSGGRRSVLLPRTPLLYVQLPHLGTVQTLSASHSHCFANRIYHSCLQSAHFKQGAKRNAGNILSRAQLDTHFFNQPYDSKRRQRIYPTQFNRLRTLYLFR